MKQNKTDPNKKKPCGVEVKTTVHWRNNRCHDAMDPSITPVEKNAMAYRSNINLAKSRVVITCQWRGIKSFLEPVNCKDLSLVPVKSQKKKNSN